MTKFYVDVSANISNKLPEKVVQVIVLEFIKYKEAARHYEHPVPSIKIQKNTISATPQFGRDRFDTAHRAEDVQHLHLRDGSRPWEDEQGLLAQWDCTSDTHLIYSYFKYGDAYYYYLIEVYDDNAHKNYEKAKHALFKQAREFKEQKIKELSSPKSA